MIINLCTSCLNSHSICWHVVNVHFGVVAHMRICICKCAYELCACVGGDNYANMCRSINNLFYKVSIRIITHLSSHDLLAKFQSAYRKFHSSETALVYVQNDILVALEAGHSTALLLLDLSAAFDTIAIIS